MIDLAKIPQSFEEEFESLITRKELSKGDLLFEQGQVCRHIYFIEKGLARVFYYSASGKEITAWFSAENTFITAVDSLFQHKPTRDFCELLEDSVVYSISYPDFEAMLNKENGARLAFHVLFEITRKITEFVISIKFQTAEERYKTLMNDFPAIFQRAQLGHIASYLGITQETLSRIRAGK
jgi:cAMP-binding proteins - catabolite gene activator and regulatory subunit of cAMP-dependent protein kinases